MSWSSARDSAGSDTVSTASTCLLMIAKGMSPGRPTAMPSAIVAIFVAAMGRPAASDIG